MGKFTRTLFIFAAAAGLSACRSVSKPEHVSARYLQCDEKKLKPVEITNHGWYRSWYVDCRGQEYFCRYSETNENGWNGCRPSVTN